MRAGGPTSNRAAYSLFTLTLSLASAGPPSSSSSRLRFFPAIQPLPSLPELVHTA